jgi:hypothetical protein
MEDNRPGNEFSAVPSNMTASFSDSVVAKKCTRTTTPRLCCHSLSLTLLFAQDPHPVVLKVLPNIKFSIIVNAASGASLPSTYTTGERIPRTHMPGIRQNNSRQVGTLCDITIHQTILPMPNPSFRSFEGVRSGPGERGEPLRLTCNTISEIELPV